MKEISLQFLDFLERYLFFTAVHIHIIFRTFEDNSCMHVTVGV